MVRNLDTTAKLKMPSTISNNQMRRTDQPMGNCKEVDMDLPLVDTKIQQRMDKRRLVTKGGACNAVHTRVSRRRRSYLVDIFTTLVDQEWRWSLLVFTCVYCISWFFFGLVWYALAWAHNDLGEWTGNGTKPECVYNLDSFTGSFLFSIETQTTIGYGYISVADDCSSGVFLVLVQSVVSVLIDAIFTGFIFSKIQRPGNRSATLRFSRRAVIALRDGALYFMFRLGDIRESQLLEAHVRVYLIKQKITDEGEVIPMYQHTMDVGQDSTDDSIFLVWPLIVSHKIQQDSPLYEYSCDTLPSADFEIVVILEGIIETTGLTVQARTSYLPSEIVWGHRFCSSVPAREELITKAYNIDYSKFDATYIAPKHPRCSAKEMDDVKKRNGDLSGNDKSDQEQLVMLNPHLMEEAFGRCFQKFMKGEQNDLQSIKI